MSPVKKTALLVMSAFFVSDVRPVEGGPVTFLTASPVAQSQAVVRGQYFRIRASDDPTPAERDLTVNAVPLAVAIGVTPRLTIFGIVPIVNKSIHINTPIGRVTRDSTGVGDIVTFARYTVYAVDMADSTFRMAPFGGVKLPAGASETSDALGLLPRPLQPGSGSWDGLGGLAVTYQTKQWELDYQLQWFDVSVQPLRWVGYHLFWLWPRPVTSTAGFFAPTDAAIGARGVIHVADSGNHRVVMLSPEGEHVSEWRIPDAAPSVFSSSISGRSCRASGLLPWWVPVWLCMNEVVTWRQPRAAPTGASPQTAPRRIACALDPGKTPAGWESTRYRTAPPAPAAHPH